MLTTLLELVNVLLLSVVIAASFFAVVVTGSAAYYCGMPNFWKHMPKKEKGKFKASTGLVSRFNAFGGRDFIFPITFRSNRIAYIVSRVMAMYLDYLTMADARTYSVIWQIKNNK